MTRQDNDWPGQIYDVLGRHQLRQVAHVPDAGHKRLLDLCVADPEKRVVTLTSEEEGVGLLTGAWLGGEKGVLLMQSSGVGNCVNALAMVESCRVPILILVAMRGEWGEFNPWQMPMGLAVEPVLTAINAVVLRAEAAADVAPTVEAAAGLAFNGQRAVAVLLSQRLIGSKSFAK
jgi:sulfopyruvate decarboxylase alpha subunit